MEKNNNLLGSWLKIKGLTHEQFAEKIGMTRQSVARFLKQQDFTPQRVTVFAKALGIEDAVFYNPELYVEELRSTSAIDKSFLALMNREKELLIELSAVVAKRKAHILLNPSLEEYSKLQSELIKDIYGL